MNAEETKSLIREMLKSPEGALLVRAALTRPAGDPNPVVEDQLEATEAETRRWVVRLPND